MLGVGSHRSPHLWSALIPFPGPVRRAWLWTVMGTGVRRNEREEVTFPCKAEAPLPLRLGGPPGSHCYKTRPLKGCEVAFDSGSLHYLTRSALWDERVPALRWYCFLAVFLLMVSRPQPCCLGPWCIFHPPRMTVCVTQLPSYTCPWKEQARGGGGFYQRANLYWQTFSFVNGPGTTSVQSVTAHCCCF